MGNTFIHVEQTLRQGIGDKLHIGEMWYEKHIYTWRADRGLETSFT